MMYPTACCKAFLLCILFFSAIGLSAQVIEPYEFQDLSHVYYAAHKDSIKKNWKCPVISGKKETQKKYQELWDERTSFIANAIESDNYLHDKEVYDYLDKILSEITKSNKVLIPVKPLLLLDRSAAVNAYSTGGNIIAINTGLVAFLKYREDLAFVIAHELAHNILAHADNSIRERAEWLTSDEYKKSMDEVLDSKYGRFTRLKNVFERFSFDRSRHNRYHEGNADSLAITLLKNSRIPFDPEFFLRLDSSDNQYKLPLKTAVKEYFASFNVPYEDWWTQKRSKGLSTKNYNFRDTSGIADSLKTHPNCKDRYKKTLSLATSTGNQTLIPASIQEKANKILLWNMFDNVNLTACLYRIMLQRDRGNNDDWYNFMIFNIFSELYYADKNLSRFNAIGVTPKEYISKDYMQLQNMLEQMPKESIQQYCIALKKQPFWRAMNNDGRALQALMNSINSDEEVTARNKENYGKEFLETHPSSMYCEYAARFKKK